MIKISKFFRYIVVFLLLIENCFFYLVEIPKVLSPYMSYFIKVLVGFLSLCVFLVVFFFSKFRRWLNDYNGFLARYVGVYILSIFAVIVFTYMGNGASIKSAFITACPYFTVLLCLPILLSMKDDESVDRILKLINIFTLMMYMLVIIQSYLYDNHGIIILKYLNKTISIRNGRVRLDVLPFGNIMLIYNLFTVFYRKEKRRLIHVINLIMGLFILFYIEQTRAMIVVVMLCYAIFLITENSTKSKLFTNTVLIIVILITLLNTGAFDRFLATFSSKDYAGSSIAREYAIDYYLSVFQSSPLYGFGFTSSDTVIHGNRGIAYIDDVGIFGQMAKLGIFALVILVPIIIRWGKIAIYMKKRSGSNLYISLWFYFVATSATIMILDSQRIMLFPFLIAIFEFVYMKERQTEWNEIKEGESEIDQA